MGFCSCLCSLFVLVFVVLFCHCELAAGSFAAPTVRRGNHTNNWAVLVSTSRFWFNYRHAANALAMYRIVRRMGIPDSQIILMISDDHACNPRNIYPAQIYSDESHSPNLYGGEIGVEVDYRGYEVTVENFLRVLTGRHSPDTPRSQRLLSDETSNVLIYLSGHGGEEFLKFQDSEEVTSSDLADAIAQLHEQGRYNELFLVVDTCQAATLHQRIYSPNVLAIGGSLLGENSYSYQMEPLIGLALIDRFTYWLCEFFEHSSMSTLSSFEELFASLTFDRLHSHPDWRSDLFPRSLNTVPATDFFGQWPRMKMSFDSNEVPDLTALSCIDSEHTSVQSPPLSSFRFPHQSPRLLPEKFNFFFFSLPHTFRYWIAAFFIVVLLILACFLNRYQQD